MHQNPVAPRLVLKNFLFFFFSREWEQRSAWGLLWGCGGHRVSIILDQYSSPVTNLTSHLACEQRAHGSEAWGGWLRGFLDREKMLHS